VTLEATLQYTHNVVYQCSCDNARVIILQCQVINSIGSKVASDSVWILSVGTGKRNSGCHCLR